MDQLVVTSTLPAFIGNFDAVKSQLLEGIKKYEIEVTEDNLSEAKKMATELNKLSTVIGKVKSDKVKEISEPIEVFKVQVAELVDICQAGREKILVQVKTFEDKTRAKVKELIEDEFMAQLNTLNIRKEFRNYASEDFANVSAITKSGALTKSAKEAVTKKVSEFKILQDKVDMRLLQLENAGLKAGLKSPLRKEHVESFLMAPDDQYDINLSKIIGIEVARQAETENKFQQEQTKRPLRFFTCAVCRHVVTDYDLPSRCPKCPSAAFKEHSSLQEAHASPAPSAPVPPASSNPLPPPPRPIAPPIAPPAAPPQPVQWNQDRLHQMRHHIGDETFFQMFKIVYLPISDRALQDATSRHPDLTAALEWATGENKC